MSSHSYSGIRRWWMLDSMATKVARFAEIHVLILPDASLLESILFWR
ncbi:MAG: hypothetical protein M3Y76_10015 [Chloroflexota bacterium]|nr:hypothetical protein [Chloroflexota bacterium]